MCVYGSVLESVESEVVDGLLGNGPERSRCLRYSGSIDFASTSPVTRRNRRGAEGSRTPGLLDATEAL